MKAATGELQLTVITMIAIAAVIAFFWFMWPNIKNSIGAQWGDISCQERDANGQCIGGNNTIDTDQGVRTGN